ncbi:MAG: hypothetical protein H6565_09380 [Lewinellaceae bacterium]|nr:hypothetical protein [Lewinellaceae bacterium]MCB9354424.1 hypothetical protein [Lewinellaceae bacterium]
MHEFVPPPIIQPDIVLWGLRIAEPVTSMTALLIAVICGYAWRRLGKTLPGGDISLLLRAFFFLMALATLFGGIIGHAFLYKVTFVWKVPGWVLSMISIAALERAAILHAKPLMPSFWGRFFSVLNIVELGIFLYLALSTLNFHFVEIHAGYGLLIVVSLFEGYVYRKRKDAGSKLILLAIPLAALAAALHLAKFSFSVWFTYFDIGHILMCICAWMMMLGAERMTRYGQKTHSFT